MPFVAPGFFVLVIENMHVCSSVKQSRRAVPGLALSLPLLAPLSISTLSVSYLGHLDMLTLWWPTVTLSTQWPCLGDATQLFIVSFQDDLFRNGALWCPVCGLSVVHHSFNFIDRKGCCGNDGREKISCNWFEVFSLQRETFHFLSWASGFDVEPVFSTPCCVLLDGCTWLPSLWLSSKWGVWECRNWGDFNCLF